jgi:hypothetical protein
MPLSKIEFRPGVFKDGTQYTAEGTWYDSDKIRFRKGRPEKIGGWVQFVSSTFRGIARSLFDWVSEAGTKYLGIGTNLKLYVVEGNAYSDITPIRRSVTLGTDPFTVTNGSTTVTVADTNHGAALNDFVTFSGATGPIGGVPASDLNQELQVTQVVNPNSYTVEVATTATSNATGGGASVDADYQIQTGLNAFVGSTGWGAGTWGSGGWGSTTPTSAAGQLRLWSQDEFGEDLVACVRGGGVYYWDSSSGTSSRAVALSDLAGSSDAPSVALQVMVSDVDRHVICFGANPIGSTDLDPLFVRWSDQEDAANWTPAIDNTAGGQRVSTGSLIIGALKTRQEILIWTDSGVESMRFGGDFVFNFQVVNRGVSMISPNAAVNANGVVYFMDRGGFYIYNGAVQPLPCPVQDFVFDSINLAQSYKVFAATNIDFNEVMWFYPVGDGDTEITRYVKYNYVDQVWDVGTFERTAWTSANSRQNPIAASSENGGDNNVTYFHEVGDDADGDAMTAYIESGDIDVADGEDFLFVHRMIPDVEFSGDAPTVDIIIKGRNFPGQALSTLSTSAIDDTTQQVFVRNRSRQMVVRYESDSIGTNWRAGALRVDGRPDGRR